MLLAKRDRTYLRVAAGLAAVSLIAILAGAVLAGVLGLAATGVGGAVYAALRRRDAPESLPPSDGGTAAAVHGTLAGARRYTAPARGVTFAGSHRTLVPLVVIVAFVTALGVILLVLTLHPRLAPPEDLGGDSDPGRAVAGLFGAAALACGLLGATVVANSLGGRPGISLLEEGVYLRTLGGTGWVRWRDLQRVSVALSSKSQRAWTGGVTEKEVVPWGIALLADRPEHFRLTGLLRWRQAANRRSHEADVRVQVAFVPGDPDEVVALCRTCLDHPQLRDQLSDPGVLDELFPDASDER